MNSIPKMNLAPHITKLNWLPRDLKQVARFLEVAIAILFVLQLVPLIYNSARPNQPILGLKYQGKSITGQSSDQLKQTVNSSILDAEHRPVTVVAPNYTGHITPRQLGVKYSGDSVMTKIVTTGRNGTFWENLITQDEAVFYQKNIVLGYPSISAKEANAYFDIVNQRIAHDPIDAKLSLASDKLIIVPEQSGVKIDNIAALKALNGYNPGINAPSLVLPVTNSPADITGNDLKPLLPKAEALTSKPMLIKASSKEITLSRQDLADLIVPTRQPTPQSPTTKQVSLSFNETKISSKLDDLAKQVAVAPQPKVVSGSNVISNGQAGVHIDGTHAKIAVLTTLTQRSQPAANYTTSPNVAVVPVETIDPPVINRAALPRPGETPINIGNGWGVTLTFDDGPGQFTEQILDILKQKHAHATFFLVGKNVRNYPSSARRISAEGHTIGNHSYTHSNLSLQTPAGIASELTSTQAIINSVTGVNPNIFRPPYGSINDAVRQQAAAAGLKIMMWSLDPRDWAQPGSSVITQRILSAASPGANILLHVLHAQTVEALPGIIDGLRAKGYVFN